MLEMPSATARDRETLIDRYRKVRQFSEELCRPLEIEDLFTSMGFAVLSGPALALAEAVSLAPAAAAEDSRAASGGSSSRRSSLRSSSGFVPPLGLEQDFSKF